VASVELGAILAGAGAEAILALTGYAKNLGLAFQITDDLLDAGGSEIKMGKPSGQDAGRTTFVTLCGAEGARTLAEELVDTAIRHLHSFGESASLLRDLAGFVARRDR
jgi:farnesyl diphosphate synthase